MNMKICFVIFILLVNLIFNGCTYYKIKDQNIYPAASLQLNPIFTNHMVLQRNRPIKIYGNAEPNRLITVNLAENDITALSDINGRWLAELPPMKAGGPYSLTVKGKRTITLNNILIGDVWICSGQSNMQWPLKRADNAQNEINVAEYPQIRLFTVERLAVNNPVSKVKTINGWRPCSRKSAADFSAAGYFFGRKLHQKLNIPIGLINSSWGGTRAEAWTSVEMLRTLPSLQSRIDATAIQTEKQQLHIAEYKRVSALRRTAIKKIEKLESDAAYGEKMASLEFDDSKWSFMKLPANWENAGLPGYDGIVWFRKNVEIPTAWKGKKLILKLGAIDEVDVTFFNGKKIGGKGRMKGRVNQYWKSPRQYTIPGELVTPGKTIIATMVIDVAGKGGIWGGDDPEMIIHPADQPSEKIELSGNWRYFAEPTINVPKIMRNPVQLRHNPGFLFNGMINPLLKFPITGVIWYQGESNAARAYQYRKLFPAMIQDWRIRSKQGEFPFFFVQLANFRAKEQVPEESAWAELREAQLMTLRLPNTGMAVTIDIGDADDIHPRNKQDVGKRLAYNALATYYKQPFTQCGPVFSKLTFKGSYAYLNFTHLADGLYIPDNEKLNGFTIAGKNRKFFKANAEIEKDQVVVWHEQVKNPVAVRYGWANNPDCNLYNSEKLPASPFRTDNWPGITIKNK